MRIHYGSYHVHAAMQVGSERVLLVLYRGWLLVLNCRRLLLLLLLLIWLPSLALLRLSLGFALEESSLKSVRLQTLLFASTTERLVETGNALGLPPTIALDAPPACK